MKKALFFLFCFSLLTACQNSTEPATEIPAVGRVGQENITEEDVRSRLLLLSEEDRNFAQSPIGRQNLLHIIAREKLIAAATKEEKLDESDIYLTLLEDKRTQLADIYQEYAAQLLEQMWYDSLQEKGLLSVSKEEIDNYYDKYPYEMTVRQIIVDNAQTADQVLRTLKNSPSRWREMARQYSVAPQAIREESFSFMPGEFLPEIEVIAANSPSGSVQGFIKTAQGFHIIMKSGEKRLSRKDAEPRIRAVLEGKKLDELLENLKKKHEVVIYEKAE